MATSTLDIYVNRNGFDTLWGQHTGLGAGVLAETFNFPEGVWEVSQLTVITFGDVNLSASGFEPAVYHIDSTSTIIGALPNRITNNWYDSGHYQVSTFGMDLLHYQPSDSVYVAGSDIDSGTSGTCQVGLVARRLL